MKLNKDYAASHEDQLPENARTAEDRAKRSENTEIKQLVAYIDGASARPEA